MTSSILHRELTLDQNLLDCRDFWGIHGESPLELYNGISKKLESLSFLSQIEALDPYEAQFLYTLYLNGGRATSVDFINNKILSQEELEGISQRLNSKYLIYIRKSISQIKIVARSYSIYPEIFDQLRKISILTLVDLKNTYFKAHKVEQNSPFSSHWQKIFQVNLGQFHTQSLADTTLKDEVIKHHKEKNCSQGLFFHSQFYTVSLIEPDQMVELNNGSRPSHKYDRRTLFITRMYQIFYILKTKGIYVTHKKGIRKYDYNVLYQLFNEDKDYLQCVLKSLEQFNFIEIAGSSYQTTDPYITFLRMSLDEKYQKLLSLDSKLRKVFNLIKGMKIKSFTIWDIAKNYFFHRVEEEGYFSYNILEDSDLNENDIHHCLELLMDLGILIHKEGNYTLSPLGQNLIDNKKIEHRVGEKNGGIIVNNNHILIVYPDQINDYHYMLINLFADQLSDGAVLQYQIDKSSIQRASYLGFQATEFIKCLEVNSSQAIPDNIVYNIKSWAQKIKKVYVKTITVLEGSEDVLHILRNDKKIAECIEPIGEKYLLCKKDNFPPYIEGEDPIFIMRENEDLQHENDKRITH